MGFTKRDTAMMKGAAICLMLWHHLFTFPERLEGIAVISMPFINGDTLAVAAGQFGKICVALFALLSGYGTYLSARSSADTDGMTGRHLLKMYSSYWLVYFIAVPVSLLLGKAAPDPFWEDLIYGALGFRFSYCSEWWFITPLSILLIMFPFIRRAVDRPRWGFMADFAVLTLVNAVICYLLPRIMEAQVLARLNDSFFWLEFFTVLTLLPSFAMGCILAKHDIFGKVKERSSGGFLHCAAALAVLAALFLIHPFNWVFYDYINAALFICCLLVLLKGRWAALPGRLLEALGRESTFMWLTHSLFCYHWCKKLVFAPKVSVLIFLLLLVMSYIAARLLSLLYAALGRLFRRAHEIKLP